MNNGVVIIGTGHGGVQAAASLREEGFDGPVVLVGDDRDLPYHKPPLSKTFIKDAAAAPQPLRGETFYTGHDIDLRLGTTVERIDLPARRLLLADGGAIPFDRLVLATGSTPRRIDFGAHWPEGVLMLRTLADAVEMRQRSASAADVVVLGGGFIGLEIAATLAAGGRRVTVVEAQERVLGRAVPPLVAAHVRARLEASGIRVLPGTVISGLEASGGRLAAVTTSTGERIPADLLIVGVGAVPVDALARAAGIATANGVRVDPLMRSSVPEVLAIGDVANYRHFALDSDVRLESVQNATDQAKLAARTIVGRGEDYHAVPWFWSDIGDAKLQMVGLPAGADREIVVGDRADNRFAVYRYKGDRLVGIDTVNRPADHMLGRKMMEAGFSPPPELVLQGTDAVKAAFMGDRRR